MTFEQLHHLLTPQVKANGSESIDFLGSFGPHIQPRLEGRFYVEAGNATPLVHVSSLTVEPQIRELGDVWGYKWEEVYRFGVDGIAHPLSSSSA